MKKTLLLSTLLALFIDAVQFLGHPHQFGSVSAFAASGNPVALAATAPAKQPALAKAIIASPTPAFNPVFNVQSKLSSAGLKPDDAALYLAVQARTGTPWQLIAAVHATETHQSGSTESRSTAGAVGPFQFMPATWQAYAIDGDNDGHADITDLTDAAYTAGHYLAVSGAAKGDYRSALFNYNHSNDYVNHVMSIAHKLGL